MTNTFLIASKQPAQVPISVVINKEAAIKHFSEALTYKTISYQDREKFDLQEFDR